jgi:hypothetical protein
LAGLRTVDVHCHHELGNVVSAHSLLLAGLFDVDLRAGVGLLRRGGEIVEGWTEVVFCRLLITVTVRASKSMIPVS